MSETAADDLTAWLTQIWDEEQRLATRAGDALTTPEIDNYGHLTVPSGWMLDRITADRRILAFVQSVQEHAGDPPGWDPSDADALGHVVKLIGSAYADRPGYRQEWKP